jgi:hypothetical protein
MNINDIEIEDIKLLSYRCQALLYDESISPRINLVMASDILCGWSRRLMLQQENLKCVSHGLTSFRVTSSTRCGRFWRAANWAVQRLGTPAERMSLRFNW